MSSKIRGGLDEDLARTVSHSFFLSVDVLNFTTTVVNTRTCNQARQQEANKRHDITSSGSMQTRCKLVPRECILTSTSKAAVHSVLWAARSSVRFISFRQLRAEQWILDSSSQTSHLKDVFVPTVHVEPQGPNAYRRLSSSVDTLLRTVKHSLCCTQLVKCTIRAF